MAAATQAVGLLFPAQLLVSVGIALYLLSVARWRARTQGRPLPPGPKRLPVVGNMFNMPRSRQWLAFQDLSRDILHFRVLGQSVVVLGSADVIFEYLDKRSANTSDRVQTPMVELSGASYNFGFMPYGQWWRRHRRAFWQYFNRDAIKHYQPTQRSITHVFLEMLLENPSHMDELFRFNFASTLMGIVYGIEIKDKDDVYVQILEESSAGIMEGLIPGKFLVDFLPFLRYIPPWVPGAMSQRLWAKWMAAGERHKNAPFEHTKAMLMNGEDTNSIISKLLDRMAQCGTFFSDDEEVIKDVGAVTFQAGTDTVLSTILGVVLGVSLHPEVLRKAHAELDALVGPHRLPDFGDRDSLVYVNAIIKETLRWHTVLPINIPHATVTDDEFYGYFIPAGTMLIANIWACMHDPEVYKDPEVFRPERFIRDGRLDTSVRDPTAFVFGYGRRICPGRYFAEATLFITIACVLHVFDVGPPLGDDGHPIKIEHIQSDTLVSHPEDCRCTIKPRSAAAKALIRSCAAEVRSQTGSEAAI